MAITSNKIEETAKKLDNAAKTADAVVAETRLHFDTLVQLQMEEKKQMRKHYGKIIFGLIITLFLLIGGIFGTVLYLFTNYDFAAYTSAQDLYIGGDGNQDVYDGIHFNNIPTE